MSGEKALHRREFASWLLYGIWSAILAALGAPAAVYLLLPPRAHKDSGWVEAGNLRQLEVNAPTQLVFRRNRVDGWKVASEKTAAWVIKTPGNEVVAFAPQCTHLGCAYHWEEARREFVCPCHSSTFGIDGKVLSGPAPRPLDQYRVKVEGNAILLGPVERSAEQSA